MRLNLIMVFIWLLIAVPLLLVNLTGVDIPNVARGRQSLLIGSLAGVMALYNLVRWAAARTMSRRRSPPPPNRKRIEGQRLEYNPQFDFNREDGQTLKIDDEDTKA